MYCIVSQRVLPPLSDDQRHDLLTQAHLSSLAQVLEAVPDPRGRHGLRYDLPFLLCCLVAAVLCNCNGSEAVAQWCREQEELLRQVFGSRLFLTPSGSLYRWLLPRLGADSLERVLAAWVQATLVATPDEAIALDGKALRGAVSGEQEAPQLLAFCTHDSQETRLASLDRGENQRDPRCQSAPLLASLGRTGLYGCCAAYPCRLDGPPA